jgi:lantibiotic modifying enzyme
VQDKLIIADSLQSINKVLANSPTKHDGFLGGKLGTIYYYFRYSAAMKDAATEALARNLLNEYITQLTENTLHLDPYSYCNGLAGFAYVMAELHKMEWINIDMQEEFEDIDEMLFNSARFLIERDHNDFLHGAFGIIHYFSGRAAEQSITTYIDQLIELLTEKMVTFDEFTCIANLSLPSNQIREKINMSLSHGLNGFLLILLKLLETPAARQPIQLLIAQCSSALYKSAATTKPEVTQRSIFPASVHLVTNETKYSNRLGWCYGDLGQLLLLHRLDQTDLLPANYHPAILDMAIATTERKSYEDTLVEDASFCHGAAGLAQFYAGLKQVSDLPIYTDAYEYWIGETLRLLHLDLEKNNFPDNEHSILDGYTGIGLTLLHYISPTEHSWGEAVLLA